MQDACRGAFDMCRACKYAVAMSKMVQVRHVPDAVHRTLKERAAEDGQSLSDYLLDILEREVQRPTAAEMLRRLGRMGPVVTDVSTVELLQEERERR